MVYCSSVGKPDFDFGVRVTNNHAIQIASVRSIIGKNELGESGNSVVNLA